VAGAAGMTETVIILSSGGDIHAQSVAKQVTDKHSKHALILDAADYPAKWQLSFRVAPGGTPSFMLRVAGQEIIDSDVAGVWWRRPQQHVIPDRVSEPKVRDFCLSESRAAFQGWIYALGRKVVNPLAAERPACHKLLQLIHATRVGVPIPKTLITNAPSDIPGFFQENQGGTIFKVLTGTEWQFSETRELDEAHFAQLPSLDLSPVIFQEKVAAELDIRATVIDDNIFSVSIRPNHPAAKIDWRLDMSAEIEGHRLPDEIARKLVALNKSLGLRYGAMDLRLTPDGRYVFLEVNPGGQFLFAEIHGGQPISQALAKALARGDDPAGPPREEREELLSSN
jgi:glutathione synthase/RimK-type ligase-like ATP-grasp enzyme